MFYSQRRAYLCDQPEFSAKSASTAKVGLGFVQVRLPECSPRLAEPIPPRFAPANRRAKQALAVTTRTPQQSVSHRPILCFQTALCMLSLGFWLQPQTI